MPTPTFATMAKSRRDTMNSPQCTHQYKGQTLHNSHQVEYLPPGKSRQLRFHIIGSPGARNPLLGVLGLVGLQNDGVIREEATTMTITTAASL